MKDYSGTIFLIVMVFVVGCWFANMYKFINCDFESPYRAEVIHAVGIFTPLSPLTVWVNDEEQK